MRRFAGTYLFACISHLLAISWLILPVEVYGTKPSSRQEEPRLCSGKLSLSREPYLGDTIQATLTVTALESLDNIKLIWGLKHTGIEVVNCRKETYFCLEKGEAQVFTASLHFISSPADFTVRLFRPRYDRSGVERRGPSIGGAGFSRILVDEETGRFGGVAEFKALRPEYQYDPMTGKMTGDIGPTQAQYNRKRMDDLRKRDPTLTDWDALYALHDLEVLFSRYGLSGEKAVEVALEASRLVKEQGMDRNEALEKVVRQREAWRLWRFAIVMLAVVVELVLLVFLTQKVPLRRKGMPVDVSN
jgi:hypothetical protein